MIAVVPSLSERFISEVLRCIVRRTGHTASTHVAFGLAHDTDDTLDGNAMSAVGNFTMGVKVSGQAARDV